MANVTISSRKTRKYLFIFILSAIMLVRFSADLRAVEGLTQVKTNSRTITVGGRNADIPGFTSRAIQIAVDALKESGGTVRLGQGKFEISVPVKLYDSIRFIGSGETTVLHKIDGFTTNYIIDGDYGMLKVMAADASRFAVGMGVLLYDDDNNSGWDVTTARITSIDGQMLYIDTPLARDYRADRNGIISNACSLVEGVGIGNAYIADFVVDGNSSTNEFIDGCRGGGIYIHKSRDVTIENVTVRNFNGDGFSWQITENVTVKNCEAAYGTNLGFHPGTGSDNSVVENCVSHHNGADGIFLCWRVQNGVFRNNKTYANERYGISIGHKDTDNIFENNQVFENFKHGVCFRDENEENSGHRNVFHGNTIENNGSPGFDAYGIYIGGVTRDITIDSNTIVSTGKGNQVGAIFIGDKSSGIVEKNNTVSGHPAVVR
ncbi:right-handed parallel beta-helix repeat-containing protein [Candidatus Latescibacterota bacterium]